MSNQDQIDFHYWNVFRPGASYGHTVRIEGLESHRHARPKTVRNLQLS